MTAILIASLLILLAALAATRLARPVHAALSLALALALTGVMQIILGAGFIGLVQFMVYVGAVAVLIIFSLLVTRPEDEPEERERRQAAWPVILLAALPVGLTISTAITPMAPAIQTADPNMATPPPLPLETIGQILFTHHAVAVLAIGILLTAVLIGAALIARPESAPEEEQP